MKKQIKSPVLIVVALFIATFLSLCFGILANTTKAEAAANDEYGVYDFRLDSYSVTYDISSNLSIAVTEDIEVHYLGTRSTGFLRDIPVDNGAQVRNVNVSLINGTELEDVYFNTQIEDSHFLTVDIGDSTYKNGKTESYRLTYEYRVTNSVINTGRVPLNPIGHGWECEINNATATMILPAGFINATVYYGESGATTTTTYEQTTVGDRVCLIATMDHLDKYNGITFDMNFEVGSVSAFFDISPYFSLIALVVLLLAVIVVKLLFFSKGILTPIVNFDAPNGMDPLMMGKLIDNSVNNTDITSMIFYWASRGYLKINFDDEDDPTLIKMVKELPHDAPAYEQHLFYGMFKNEDAIKPSQLKNTFYVTINSVKSQVNSRAGRLYQSTSLGFSILFAVLAAILLGLTPMIVAFMGFSVVFVWGFAGVIPALILYALAEACIYNKLKFSKGKKLGMYAAMAGVTAVFAVLYCFIVPQMVMSWIVSAILFVGCSLVVVLATMLVSRTKDYTEKLNQIVGFKNFISLAEKDKLEAMLEDNPQLYYHILPYAQVLGVSDIWEDKFKDITIQPPEWAVSSFSDRVFSYYLINRMVRNSMVHATMNMVSRPSSSGRNGGGFGGGGGFSGGGFGGGGGRGR